jgi:hypothetical protein
MNEVRQMTATTSTEIMCNFNTYWNTSMTFNVLIMKQLFLYATIYNIYECS